MRRVTQEYGDPVDLIWLHAAGQMGMQVHRSAEVFASWDGQGVLRIGTPDTLDADDSLAQMILHETCHALIEGPEAWHLPDWGLDISSPEQRVHEHACLRLQAALTQPYGLRSFFAATTNFRRYYDAMPDDPMEQSSDPAVDLAKPGLQRARSGPWSRPLSQALTATAAIAVLLQPFVNSESLWQGAGAPSAGHKQGT